MPEHDWHHLTQTWSWCRRCGTVFDDDVTYARPGPDGVVTSSGVPPCRPRTCRTTGDGHNHFENADPVTRESLDRVREHVERPRTVGESFRIGDDVYDADVIHRLTTTDVGGRVRREAVSDVVRDQSRRRADLIDLLALKYDQSWHLVERREGLKTTWFIEPHCLGCEHYGDDHCCLKADRYIETDDTPGWCPRRRGS